MIFWIASIGDTQGPINGVTSTMGTNGVSLFSDEAAPMTGPLSCGVFAPTLCRQYQKKFVPDVRLKQYVRRSMAFCPLYFRPLKTPNNLMCIILGTYFSTA